MGEVLLVGTRPDRALSAQWVEAPGEGWSTLAVYHQESSEHFGPDGETRAFFGGGKALTTSAFLTTALGLFPGVDSWLQLSVHHLRYNDVGGERSSTGLGDTRLWLRVAPLSWLGYDLPFAVRSGIKLPFGDFDVDADVIPLGDGQRDFEVMAELGHSFWPRSLYLSGWLGYRWRAENQESKKDFGNELFYFLQTGGRLGKVNLKVAMDGWDGASGVTEGVMVPSFQRDLLQLQATMGLDVGPGQAEAGARFALGGNNLPSGTAFVFQYFTRWDP